MVSQWIHNCEHALNETVWIHFDIVELFRAILGNVKNMNKVRQNAMYATIDFQSN